MTTLENLPKEMIINILSRLPSESVFQFISLSKFWYSLIVDPTYSSFLQYKHIFFMRLQKNNDSKKTQLILSELALDLSLNHFHLPLPFDWNQLPFRFNGDIDFYEKFHIHNHSHGLVCLTDYHRNIVLCNPTTREFRKLPPSFFMVNYPIEYIYANEYGSAVGFGYDPKSRDFKVVRIVCFRAPELYWRVEIFDLSKDRWREVQVPDIDDVQEFLSFGICHEGTLFWVMTIDFNESYIRTIYSFDMREEVFVQIRLPKIVEEIEICYLTNQIDMGVLNGSIVIFFRTCQNNHLQSNLDISELDFIMNTWKLESTLDIWKLEKNDESSVVSWSKLFTIELNSEIGRPFMFLSSEQLLTIKEEQVCLYNVKTQQFKELPMKAHAYEAGYLMDSIMKGHGCEATSFVKSLFSVRGEKY